MNTQYISEFVAVAVVHFLAVIAPGPEFVMVVRSSIAYGREKALWLSIGIGSAHCFTSPIPCLASG
jgi:threonine/homoserine/homoserine lactone efflux protein